MSAVQNINRKRVNKLNVLLSNNKNKSILVGSVTSLLFIILMIFGIIPSVSSIIAQNNENEVILEAIKKAENKVTLLQSLVEESNEKARVLRTFENVFTDGIVQQGIVRDIHRLKGDDIFLKSINFPTNYSDNQRVSSKVKQVEVSIQLDGSKQSLTSFLQRFEESKKILNISRVSFFKHPQEYVEEKGLNHDFEMNVNFAYYFWDIEN